MKDYLRYMLYSTICIVTVMVALIFFVWFTSKPYTMESFATKAPYMVLVGLTADGKVYYADVDVPIQPKWIEVASLTGIGDIAGSYGMLYSTTTAGSVPRFGAYDSTTWANMPSGTVKQVTVDDKGAVGGTNVTNGIFVSSGNTAALTATGANSKSMSISQGEAYSVGADDKLYYSANPVSSTWTLIDAGTTWKQVSLDSGVVCAIKTDGRLWCADSNIGAPTAGTTTTVGAGSGAVSLRSAANFTQQGGSSRLFKNICVKGGRLIGVGTDDNVYYSDTYKNPVWKNMTEISKLYNLSTGALAGSVPTFSKVIMFYPSTTARKKRFLGTASACNANEQRIGQFCYQACPSGKPASGTQCPYLAKTVPAIATCPRDTSSNAGSSAQTQYVNGACYKKCPAGYEPSSDGLSCIGIPVPKPTKGLNTGVTQAQQLCPSDGSITARYIRVRPSPLIANNKLCIKSFSVSLGVNEGSGGSTPYRVTATDGSDKDAPIASNPGNRKYLCGNTFDKDADGGKQNRSTKLYWELDLGSLKAIKHIDFTGCNYINENNEETTASSSPGADQIKGMIIELYKTNTKEAVPVATRTLGSPKTQRITFNYVIKNPKMPNRCYDTCPSINGVPSMRTNDYTCVAAAGGITQRAVTSPIYLGPPSCTRAIAGDGADRIYSATSQTGGVPRDIRNFVPDPSNNQFILSCDGLPGSKLKPLSTRVYWPQIRLEDIVGRYSNSDAINTYTTVPSSYNRMKSMLQAQWASKGRTDGQQNSKRVTWEEDTNAVAYTNPDTEYMCVIEPTSSTTFQVGNAVNTNFRYDPIYNSYVVDTTYTSNTVMPYAEAVNFLTKACRFDRFLVLHGDTRYNYTTSSRRDRYICPKPTGEYEMPITLLDNTQYKTCTSQYNPSDVRDSQYTTTTAFGNSCI
jgi:hypothetical protein